MNGSDPSPSTEEARAQMRQWLENWRHVGAILEQERIDRMRALTDADAARIACDLWRFAQPGRGDDGEGLLALKDALRKLRRP
jgi:hypothetical protein